MSTITNTIRWADNTADLKKNLIDGTNAVDQMKTSIEKTGTSLDSFGKMATKAGTALSLGLTAPIVAVGTLAAKAAIDFEDSFAGVRKTVDATEAEFKGLETTFRDMAKAIPVSVNELNKIGEAAGQLGIKKDDIAVFTRTMADLSVTTNLTSDQAANAIARIQNIFGAAGKDTQNLASALVALGNAGASTESDIVEMGLRIAGAGHVVGMTQAEVLSFASALSSVGIDAEAGGSAISRVFLKMNDAVMSGGPKLEEFARVAGMTAEQFKTAFQDNAAGAATAFIEGLNRVGTEGENVNAVLGDLGLEEIRVRDALLRASGAGQLLAEQLAIGNKAWAENTALTEEAAKRYETAKSQITVMWNRMQDVAITIGQALLPTIRDLLVAMTPWVESLATAAKWFAELPAPVRTVAVGLAAFLAALGPVLVAIGAMSSGIAAITPLLPALGTALTLLTGPLGLVAAAVVAVVVAWKNWDVITGYVKGVYEAVKTWLVDKFNAIIESVKGKVQAVTGFFKDMYEKVVGHSYVPDLMRGVESQFGQLDTIMVAPARQAVSLVTKQFDELGKNITTSLSHAFGVATEEAKKGAEAISQTTASASKGGFSFGGMLSGMAGGLVAGTLTSLAGAGIHALMNLGGPSKEELEGRKAVGDFEKQLASLATAQQKIEAGNSAWKLSVITVRDAYLATGRSAAEAEKDVAALWNSSVGGADAAKAAADKVNQAFLEQKQDAADLDAAIQRYGFSIEELGPAMQRQKLTEQAAGLLNDFRLLAGSGIDVGTVIDKMSGSINTFLQHAIATGTEVPIQMQPMIQKMIEMGTLTDGSGTKITDLQTSGITFAETMTQGFDRIVKKFDELIGKIGMTYDGINRLPTERTINVTYRVNTDEISNGGLTWDPSGAATGGFVTARGIQRFASGGFALGTDTVPAMLTPGELVLNTDDTATLRRAFTGNATAQAGGRPDWQTAMSGYTRQVSEGLSRLEATMAKRLPDQIAVAVAAAMAKTGRQRAA